MAYEAINRSTALANIWWLITPKSLSIKELKLKASKVMGIIYFIAIGMIQGILLQGIIKKSSIV
jgi:hypothetical protein